MKKILPALVALLLGVAPAMAHAQNFGAAAVSGCGTPPNSPVVGNPYPLTQDLTLALCTRNSTLLSSQIGVTLGAAGVFQTVAAQNLNRHSCVIQNTSATDAVLIYFGALGSAATTNSFSLPAGQTQQCAGPDGTVDGSAINVAGKASAGDTIVVHTK